MEDNNSGQTKPSEWLAGRSFFYILFDFFRTIYHTITVWSCLPLRFVPEAPILVCHISTWIWISTLGESVSEWIPAHYTTTPQNKNKQTNTPTIYHFIGIQKSSCMLEWLMVRASTVALSHIALISLSLEYNIGYSNQTNKQTKETL